MPPPANADSIDIFLENAAKSVESPNVRKVERERRRRRKRGMNVLISKGPPRTMTFEIHFLWI